MGSGHIIGKKGVNIRKLIEDSGANVQLNADGNLGNPEMKRITVTGDKESREKAFTMLTATLAEFAERNSHGSIVHVRTIEFPQTAAPKQSAAPAMMQRPGSHIAPNRMAP